MNIKKVQKNQKHNTLITFFGGGIVDRVDSDVNDHRSGLQPTTTQDNGRF